MADLNPSAPEPGFNTASGRATVVKLRELLAERRKRIRALRKDGRTLQAIADEYGLSRQRIYQILRGRR